MTRREKIQYGAARHVAFYRKNPHLLVRDYLHIELGLFQKIILLMMNICDTTVFIASRGIGKSFVSAIFCVIRCILYPGTMICVASGTRGQAYTVLEKIILELKMKSQELEAEIDWKATKANNTQGIVVFKNGSYIKIVTASESARSNRANIVLIDEFRLVDPDVITTILKKFLTQRRMPAYAELTREQRWAEYDKEKNKTVWCSSAYFADHWSYQKCIDTIKCMVTPGRRDFCCSLPYEISIKEGLLDPDVIEADMLESNFSEIRHMMEYESIFYNSADGAFFDFNTVSKNRHIQYPMLPAKLAGKLKSNSSIRIEPKITGEKRLLSADIALMASTKRDNDATAIHITRLIPTKAGRYTVNLVYTENNEGLRTEAQALNIRRLYEEFDCDYIVIDAKNVGLSVIDCLSNDISDPETGEIFPALSCCNNEELANRCVVKNAPKVIWAILGNAKFNSDVALLLREGFKSGRVRLLLNEYDGESAMNQLPGFAGLEIAEKTRLLMPYINTTLLINEAVNLRHEESNGLVRLFEKSGMRKDRYSSISYNYYVALQLENEMRRKSLREFEMGDAEEFVYRAPRIKREGW